MPERVARPVRTFLSALGPGIVSGAADDDPSGIATYSVAGAQFGTGLLWTALITWPLMSAVQMMCARIGMVTGTGLMTALRRKFPRPLLAGAAMMLLVANTINIGADLSGMADGAELLTGVNSHLWVVLFGLAIGIATIQLHYASIARVLKWLAVVLFAYVAAAVSLRPDWSAVLHATLVPVSLPPSGWATLVAILGTTISPYLFFWQASQEVEEEKSRGRVTVEERQGATATEVRVRRVDVALGAFFSNLVMFFIILTTALTLHSRGMTGLGTSREIAQALEPIAGRFAALLYTIGIIGTGVLAIPTLSCSAAYAFAEVFGWREGIDERFRGAPAFYMVVGMSMAFGAAMDFADINPVQALYWSAVLNGLLAPLLLAGILLLASDRTLMRGQPSSLASRLTVGATTAAMLAAAALMIVSEL
jgi:Mn2+/Fe2+ NRAMP family transporter